MAGDLPIMSALLRAAMAAEYVVLGGGNVRLEPGGRRLARAHRTHRAQPEGYGRPAGPIFGMEVGSMWAGRIRRGFQLAGWLALGQVLAGAPALARESLELWREVSIYHAAYESFDDVFVYTAANHFPWTGRYRPELTPGWRDPGNGVGTAGGEVGDTEPPQPLIGDPRAIGGRIRGCVRVQRTHGSPCRRVIARLHVEYVEIVSDGVAQIAI